MPSTVLGTEVNKSDNSSLVHGAYIVEEGKSE